MIKYGITTIKKTPKLTNLFEKIAANRNACIVDEDKAIAYLIVHDRNQNISISIVYDLNQKKLCSDESVFDDIKKHSLQISLTNLIEMSIIIAKSHNKYLEDTVIELVEKMVTRTYVKQAAYVSLVKYLCLRPNIIEKMIKSIPFKLLIEDLENGDLKEDESKMSKAIGLKSDLIERIEKTKLKNLYSGMITLSNFDSQAPYEMMRFIELFRGLYKKIRYSVQDLKEVDFNVFMDKIIFLLENGYTIKPLLNYLTKQSIVYEQFKFPVHTLELLVDYYSMGLDMGAKIDKYPQYMNKAHFIFIKNYDCLHDEELKKSLKKIFKTHKKYEISNDEYAIIAPSKLEDLIKEGNTLHHCVSSYGYKIEKGKSIVLFYRKKDQLDQPLITLEITDSGHLVQAKEIYNVDVHKDERKKIDDLLLELRKGL